MYSLYDSRYRPCDSAAYVDPYRYPRARAAQLPGQPLL